MKDCCVKNKHKQKHKMITEETPPSNKLDINRETYPQPINYNVTRHSSLPFDSAVNLS